MSISRTRLYEAKTRVDLAEDGVSLTFASSEQDIIEFLDDDGKVIPGQAFIQPPRNITSPELLALIGDQVPAVLAERDALEAQIDQMTTDHAAALEAKDQEKAQALEDAAAAAAEDKAAALKVLQAQLDAIQNPPIPHVISQRFKIAMEQLVPGLLATVDGWVATQPVATQQRWNYPEFYRNDEMLIETAGLIVGMVPDLPTNDPAALLDQIFDLAKTIT